MASSPSDLWPGPSFTNGSLSSVPVFHPIGGADYLARLSVPMLLVGARGGLTGGAFQVLPSNCDFYAATKAPHFYSLSIRESHEHLRDTGGTAFAIRIPSSTPPDAPSHVKTPACLGGQTPSTPQRPQGHRTRDKTHPQTHRDTQTHRASRTHKTSAHTRANSPPLRLSNLEHGARHIASAQWLIRAPWKTAEPDARRTTACAARKDRRPRPL